MNTNAHQDTMVFQQEREAFFDWMERRATENAEFNRDLSEQEILAIIEQARAEVYQEALPVTACCH